MFLFVLNDDVIMAAYGMDLKPVVLLDRLE